MKPKCPDHDGALRGTTGSVVAQPAAPATRGLSAQAVKTRLHVPDPGAARVDDLVRHQPDTTAMRGNFYPRGDRASLQGRHDGLDVSQGAGIEDLASATELVKLLCASALRVILRVVWGIMVKGVWSLRRLTKANRAVCAVSSALRRCSPGADRRVLKHAAS